MSRHWLKRNLNCNKNVDCSDCHKWSKCIEDYVKKSHELRDDGTEVVSTVKRKTLRFTEENRAKPNKYRDAMRNETRQRGTSNTVFIVKKRT
jgi:hypothetical protein